jgi:hypothetical protein
MEIFIRGLIALGIALAVAAYGFSDTAPTTSGAGVASTYCNGNYGGAIGHKGLFHKGSHGGLDGIGGHGLFGHGGHGGGATDPGRGIPRTQPGTVVFPQHPFVRGPRDFFMVD